MIYIGIDPGKNGGIAWIDPNRKIRNCMRMPQTEGDLWAELRAIRAMSEDGCHCMLERVGAMPGQGVTSMFSFGECFGLVKGQLVAAEIPFDLVAPRVWQKVFSLTRPKNVKESSTEKKNRHKAKAQQLFPEQRITHATADALLLSEYCHRVRSGILSQNIKRVTHA